MAAPVPQGDMSRKDILNASPVAELLRYVAQSTEYRRMRAENIIEFIYGDVPLSRKLLNENENIMELWRTALAYLEDPEEMGLLMGNQNLLNLFIPPMVVQGNFWWTPCGFSLWCLLSEDQPLVVPCYYAQQFAVWVGFCPLAYCSNVCYRGLVPQLAPQTKIIDAKDLQELEDVITKSNEAAAKDIESHPQWQFNFANTAPKYLHPDEVTLCARLSLAAYMPTVATSEKVYYTTFVPLVRERYIEKRSTSAVDSLNDFMEMFYTPSKPDVSSGKPVFGHGRPLADVLSEMNFELVQGFDISSTDTQGFVAKSKGYDTDGGSVVICFRGTTSLTDWRTNMKGSLVQFDPLGEGKTDAGKVHSGFYGAFKSILNIIIDKALPLISSGKPTTIIITGHSLGGALATLASAFVYSKYEPGLPENVSKLLTVTYGSPKSGNSAFGDYMKKFINAENNNKIKFYRVHNERDPVPKTPPTSMGYYHVGERTEMSLDGKIYFPSDAEKTEDDSSTQVLVGFAQVGSKLLGFHDIYVYADAMYQFRTLYMSKVGKATE